MKKLQKKYSVRTFWAFVIIFILRICSAQWNNINDCDETFNYWEPAHFLLYKTGFQTWEYSPIFAIRSYFFLWLYIFHSKLLAILSFSKISIFFLIRYYMALLSAITESTLFWYIIEYYCSSNNLNFFRATKKTFGNRNGTYFLLITIISSGMFNSTTSFLPSSFSIYIICLSFALWFRNRYGLFIFFFAFGSIISWPFISVLGFVQIIFRKFIIIFN